MFDKYKDRFKKFEEDHESVHKVIQHVEDHKIAYIAGASGVSCLIIGGVAGMKIGPDTAIKPIAKNVMLLGYKSPQTIKQEIVHIAARGDRGHVIIDAITGNVVGRSQNEAAILEGISRNSLRNNVAGLTEFASNGKKYIDLGENLSEELLVAL
jgi:hypothetical protein